MKRIILIAAVLAVAAAPAWAQCVGTVVGSNHDLRTTYGTNEVCVYCHTPHEAGPPSVPLWNHTTSTQSYTPYSSPTLNATVSGFAGTDGSVSSLCLSCHDGSVAIGSLYNPPNSGGPTNTTGTITGAALLGTDLSNDHPVNFQINSADNEIEAIGNITVPLFGAGNDEVQCASCHDPHCPDNTPFLTLSNVASALCLDCHIK